MEVLLAALDEKALSADFLSGVCLVGVGNLFVVNGYATLLNIAASLALGGAQTGLDEEGENLNLAVGVVISRENGGGCCCSSACAAEESLCSFLCLLCFLFAVDKAC